MNYQNQLQLHLNMLMDIVVKKEMNEITLDTDIKNGSCTNCTLEDSDDMLECESCKQWTHYGCTNMSIIELTKYLTTSRKWKCYKCCTNDESKQEVIKSLEWLNDSIGDDVKNINRSMKAELSNLKSETILLKNKNHQLVSEINYLKEHVKQSEHLKDKNSQLLSELKCLREKVKGSESTEDENISMRNQIIELSKQLISKQDKINSLTTALAAKHDTDVETLTIKIENLKRNNDELSNKLQDLNKNINLKNREICSLNLKSKLSS